MDQRDINKYRAMIEAARLDIWPSYLLAADENKVWALAEALEKSMDDVEVQYSHTERAEAELEECRDELRGLEVKIAEAKEALNAL